MWRARSSRSAAARRKSCSSSGGRTTESRPNRCTSARLKIPVRSRSRSLRFLRRNFITSCANGGRSSQRSLNNASTRQARAPEPCSQHRDLAAQSGRSFPKRGYSCPQQPRLGSQSPRAAPPQPSAPESRPPASGGDWLATHLRKSPTPWLPSVRLGAFCRAVAPNLSRARLLSPSDPECAAQLLDPAAKEMLCLLTCVSRR